MRRALITIFSVVGLSLLSVAEASAQIDLGKALGTLLNEAAVAAVSKSPKWEPAEFNGQKRSVKMTVPVVFSNE